MKIIRNLLSIMIVFTFGGHMTVECRSIGHKWVWLRYSARSNGVRSLELSGIELRQAGF